MPLPRLFAALPLVDRFTLHRYEAHTLASLAYRGRVSPARLAAQVETIGPVKSVEVLNAMAAAVRPRFPNETLSGADQVAGERLRVRLAETTLGEAFTAYAVEHVTPEAALPFLRFGGHATAIAAVHAINGHAGTRFSAPTSPEVVTQAADAILDRGDESEISKIRAIELARHIRSRGLFEAICTAVDRANASEAPQAEIRAMRGEAVLVEMLTNPAIQPYGDGGADVDARREKRLRILEVSGSPAVVQTTWATSGHNPEEAAGAIDALARIASVANARSLQSDDTRFPYLMCQALDVGSHIVTTLGAEHRKSLSTDSIMALRDVGNALLSGGAGRKHASWKSASFPGKFRSYERIAADFLAKTHSSLPSLSATIPESISQAWRKSAANNGASTTRVTDAVPASAAASVAVEPFPAFRFTAPEVYDGDEIEGEGIDDADAGERGAGR